MVWRVEGGKRSKPGCRAAGTVHFQVRRMIIRSRGVLGHARVVAGVRQTGRRDRQTARPVAHSRGRNASLGRRQLSAVQIPRYPQRLVALGDETRQLHGLAGERGRLEFERSDARRHCTQQETHECVRDETRPVRYDGRERRKKTTKRNDENVKARPTRIRPSKRENIPSRERCPIDLLTTHSVQDSPVLPTIGRDNRTCVMVEGRRNSRHVTCSSGLKTCAILRAAKLHAVCRV